MSEQETIHIIGAVLAGSEAAWQAANAGARVILHEMRPVTGTDAHQTGGFAELVCSNSFRSDDAETAVSDTVAAQIASAPRIAIDTPRLQGSISLFGGRFDDLSLKDYQVTLAADSPDVRLLSPVGGTAPDEVLPYYAVYGWTPGPGVDPASVPGPSTIWTLESGDTLAPGKPVTLTWDNGAGQVIGMASARESRGEPGAGLAFAIPSNVVKAVVDRARQAPPAGQAPGPTPQP